MDFEKSLMLIQINNRAKNEKQQIYVFMNICVNEYMFKRWRMDFEKSLMLIRINYRAKNELRQLYNGKQLINRIISSELLIFPLLNFSQTNEERRINEDEEEQQLKID